MGLNRAAGPAAPSIRRRSKRCARRNSQLCLAPSLANSVARPAARRRLSAVLLALPSTFIASTPRPRQRPAPDPSPRLRARCCRARKPRPRVARTTMAAPGSNLVLGNAQGPKLMRRARTQRLQVNETPPAAWPARWGASRRLTRADCRRRPPATAARWSSPPRSSSRPSTARASTRRSAGPPGPCRCALPRRRSHPERACDRAPRRCALAGRGRGLRSAAS